MKAVNDSIKMCDSQTLFQLKLDDGQRCSEADPMGSVIRGAWQREGGMPEMWHSRPTLRKW